MLNAGDIEFMAESQDEIYELRKRPITVIYLDIEIDPVSGIELGEKEMPREIEAVVTELSINKANGSRKIDGGIEYEEGDIKVDIKIEEITDISDKITRFDFDGEKYESLGSDKKGIGRRNRIEFLGREIS